MKFLLPIFIILMAIAPNCYAAPNDLYVIKEVAVSREDADATKAQAAAIQEAEKEAFDELGRRLLEYGYIDSVPKDITPEQITDAVQKRVVVEEKITDTLYKAKLDFTFNPRHISKLMDIKIIGGKPKRNKFLVIPITTDDGGFDLWAHEWYDAWTNYRKDNLIVPLGDLEDMKMLKAKDLKRNNYTGADGMARKYNAPIIVLAKAEYVQMKNTVIVQLERFEGYSQDFYELDYPGGLGVGASELYQTAANDIVFRLENDELEKEDMIEPEEEYNYQPSYTNSAGAIKPKTIEAYVVVKDLAEWSKVRHKIMNVGSVSNVLVTSFSPGKATVEVKHNVQTEALIVEFEDQGLDLKLIDEDENIWEIKERVLKFIIDTPKLEDDAHSREGADKHADSAHKEAHEEKHEEKHHE